MKIKWIKSGAKFNMAYFVGDVCDIDEKKGTEIVKQGYAKIIEVEVDEAPKKKTVKK